MSGDPKGHVKVEDFRLSYDTLHSEVEAVKDVSLHVNPGEFVSIIGPSGCGKSTLLNAVAGFLKPTGGTITVDGERGRRPERRSRHGVSAVLAVPVEDGPRQCRVRPEDERQGPSTGARSRRARSSASPACCSSRTIIRTGSPAA